MQYDTDPGVYDVKFADIIEPFEAVIVRRAACHRREPGTAPKTALLLRPQVSSSPVSTATSISALGDLAAVGAKFAKSRNSELVKATEVRRQPAAGRFPAALPPAAAQPLPRTPTIQRSIIVPSFLRQRTADGSLVYTLELKGETYHELLALSINRGKLL